MMIHEITEKVGAHKKRKRVGRGRASGLRLSGRGHKGAGSRAGHGDKSTSKVAKCPSFVDCPSVASPTRRSAPTIKWSTCVLCSASRMVPRSTLKCWPRTHPFIQEARQDLGSRQDQQEARDGPDVLGFCQIQD